MQIVSFFKCVWFVMNWCEINDTMGGGGNMDVANDDMIFAISVNFSKWGVCVWCTGRRGGGASCLTVPFMGVVCRV